jgi:hypothetical protein
MDPQPPERLDPELDALLRTRRPAPDAAWVRATEERLLPRRRRRFVGAWPPLPAARLGAALAVGVAVVLLALSLAGVGPLGGDNRSVQAKDDCRDVRVTRVERVPSIVKDSRGRPQVRYSTRRVTRLERRCR